jgi:hypothetical protein
MASRRAMVTVCRQGVSAYEEPRVLFEAGGKLYLSVAVIEYDPEHPQLTEAQRESISQLHEHLYSGGEKVHAVHVALAEFGGGIITANMVGPGPGQGDPDGVP